jgi:hypothetical protein
MGFMQNDSKQNAMLADFLLLSVHTSTHGGRIAICQWFS